MGYIKELASSFSLGSVLCMWFYVVCTRRLGYCGCGRLGLCYLFAV